MAQMQLDLHGFKKDQVLEVLDRFLMEVSKKNQKTARILTGKGTGVIQKQVIQYLKQAHYPWIYEKLSNGKMNEGVLIIFP